MHSRYCIAVLLQLWATLAVLTPGYLLLLLLPALPFYSNLEDRGARDKRTGDNGDNGGDPQFWHQYCDEMFGEGVIPAQSPGGRHLSTVGWFWAKILQATFKWTSLWTSVLILGWDHFIKCPYCSFRLIKLRVLMSNWGLLLDDVDKRLAGVGPLPYTISQPVSTCPPQPPDTSLLWFRHFLLLWSNGFRFCGEMVFCDGGKIYLVFLVLGSTVSPKTFIRSFWIIVGQIKKIVGTKNWLFLVTAADCGCDWQVFKIRTRIKLSTNKKFHTGEKFLIS